LWTGGATQTSGVNISLQHRRPGQGWRGSYRYCFRNEGFIIEKKDGSKIGYIWHFNMLAPYMNMLELGYGLVPSERGKGYCTEAAQLMVDYLFLSKDIVRIHATTHTKNVISQKVLEKVGFKREGTMRKCYFNRGEWTDMFIFSILGEEWKEPKILTKKTLV
jgi:RimJ/RimL family protein N-acetyltransferase